MINALSLIQAAADTSGAYGHFPGIGARNAVWIAAEVHLMFAAFVLGVPMFAVITEAVGIFTKDARYKERYDRLSKEFTRLLLVAYSATAIWGAVLTFFLTTLYPRFWNHMTEVFHLSMWVYASLFFVESFTLYLYYYGWDRWKQGRAKLGHWTLGILLNVWGTMVMLIDSSSGTRAASVNTARSASSRGNEWVAIFSSGYFRDSINLRAGSYARRSWPFMPLRLSSFIMTVSVLKFGMVRPEPFMPAKRTVPPRFAISSTTLSASVFDDA